MSGNGTCLGQARKAGQRDIFSVSVSWACPKRVELGAGRRVILRKSASSPSIVVGICGVIIHQL